MEIQVIESEDGSSTLFLPSLDETYHSTHGAIQESNHVFIQNGLSFFEKGREISVLEVGFGTGLNAFLTLQWAIGTGAKIQYDTLEPFPLLPSVVDKLNYPSFIVFPESEACWKTLHTCEWNQQIAVHDNFKIRKREEKLLDVKLDSFYDIVYYDAFAPSKQVEMWSLESIKVVCDALKNGGFLVTYCSSGQFKRNLRGLGFTIEVLEGPPGKREMVKAVKNE